MQYLVETIETSPLTFHFSFYNPEHSEEIIYVPKLLRPLGYFIRLQVKEGMNILYQTNKPKVKLKLHPGRRDSYLAIEPGYSYGAILKVEDFLVPSGIYHLHLTYSNDEFKGFRNHSLGEMEYETMLPIHVDQGT